MQSDETVRGFTLSDYTDAELEREMERRKSKATQDAIKALNACTAEQAKDALERCRHGLCGLGIRFD